MRYLGAWTAVAVLTSTHAVLVYSVEGPVSTSTIRYVAVTSFSYWLVWAVGGLVAVAAARRFPVVEQQGWRRVTGVSVLRDWWCTAAYRHRRWRTNGGLSA